MEADSGDKRSARKAHFSMRLPPGLKDRLESEAKDKGRSLSQEVESRLEQSFNAEDVSERAVSKAFDLFFSDDPYVRQLIILSATAVRVCERFEGKKMLDDRATRIRAAATIKIVVDELFATKEMMAPLTSKHVADLEREAMVSAAYVMAVHHMDPTTMQSALEELHSMAPEMRKAPRSLANRTQE